MFRKSTSTWLWHVSRVLIALVLITASFLKIRFLISPNVSSFSFVFLGPRFLMLVIILELIVASALLFFGTSQMAGRLSVVVFSLFAVAAIGFGFLGQRSCQCLGHYELNPFLLAFFDISVALIILFAVPIGPKQKGLFAEIPRSELVLGLCVALPFLVGFGLHRTSLGRHISARFNGQDVYLIKAAPSAGVSEVPASGFLFCDLIVGNSTADEVGIVGYRHNCSVRSCENLPIEIPPHGSEIVRIQLRNQESSMFLSRYILLDTVRKKNGVLISAGMPVLINISKHSQGD